MFIMTLKINSHCFLDRIKGLLLLYLLLLLLLLVLQSLVDLSHFLLKASQQKIFIWGGVVIPMPHPQPGGPGCPFLAGSSPLTLSGMGGRTSSYRHHISPDHLTTQRTPLRQSRDTYWRGGGELKP